MILFINTFITDATLPGRTSQQKLNNRVFLKSYSPLDIFKYSLASLSVAHTWSRVIFNISLDTKYLPQKELLEEFIHSEFKNVPINLSWDRNLYQKDWQKTYNLFDDDLIWFSCNHDHIFIDSSQDYLNMLVSEMKKEADGLISACYTHWPEQVAYLSKNKTPSELCIFDEYATMNMINVDSINIISRNLYKKWWFSNTLPDNLQFPRTDWPQNMIFNHVDCGTQQKNFIPFKELSRHFDAYYHIDMHQCPALNIPDGFFEKEMKISIGNSERIDGYTWCNPMIKLYMAENEMGVDYKWSNEDLPISWKNKCKDIKVFLYPENWYESRVEAITDMLYVNYQTRMIFDSDVLKKLVSVWVKPYNLTAQ